MLRRMAKPYREETAEIFERSIQGRRYSPPPVPQGAVRLTLTEHWPWAQTDAGAVMRHFADVRAIDRMGDAADFAFSHNATPPVAELLLGDIAMFEAERQAKR